jgi:hypothetical protein
MLPFADDENNSAPRASRISRGTSPLRCIMPGCRRHRSNGWRMCATCSLPGRVAAALKAARSRKRMKAARAALPPSTHETTGDAR